MIVMRIKQGEVQGQLDKDLRALRHILAVPLNDTWCVILGDYYEKMDFITRNTLF